MPDWVRRATIVVAFVAAMVAVAGTWIGATIRSLLIISAVAFVYLGVVCLGVWVMRRLSPPPATRVMYVSDEAWEQLQDELARPPESSPGLVALYRSQEWFDEWDAVRPTPDCAHCGGTGLAPSSDDKTPCGFCFEETHD